MPSNVLTNKKYKDALFAEIFGKNKENALSLYNAINNTHIEEPSLIEFNTIGDAMYMGIKNDVSFTLLDVVNIWEHQSTKNPNMAFRMVDYLMKVYQKYIKKYKLDKFSSKPMKLPVPKFVVFYNGSADAPDEEIIEFSDLLMTREGIKSDINATVRVLNINYRKNKEIMESCEALKGYSWFVDAIRKNMNKGMTLSDAADTALASMSDQYSIKTYLEEHRAEVIDMLNWEFKESDRQNAVKEGVGIGYDKGKADGVAEGIVIGKTEGSKEMYKKMYEKNLHEAAKLVATKKLSRTEAAKAFNVKRNDLKKAIEELS